MGKILAVTPSVRRWSLWSRSDYRRSAGLSPLQAENRWWFAVLGCTTITYVRRALTSERIT